MKLAEALQARADLNRQIEQLKGRIYDNALVQEGESPNEDPDELIKELNKNVSTLENLIIRINMTNCQSDVDGASLTELIAQRDCINIKIDMYKTLVSTASSNTRRATKTEIKILSTVNVKELQKKIDRLSKEMRLIDNKIQQANWNIELI
ncbi:MAG: DIP1984 family protein [Erysipelotrichia bacterium]|nr:DIP1984 family protein [Erysipelotrichia bacterium]